MWGVELIVMVGMIAINSLFAGYEIALASISTSRLHVLVRDNRLGARAALYMKENMEGSLATVQLGITLVGAIAAATGGVGAETRIVPVLREHFAISVGLAEFLAVALVVLPLTIVTIIFGELIPKLFALRNKEWVCLRMSVAMQWFAWSVWPVVWLLETAVMTLMRFGQRFWQAKIDQQVQSESAELQELRASVSLARTSRLIGAQEEKIILGAAALAHRPVRDAMLPAVNIGMLDANASINDCLIAAHLDMHTRFPVAKQAGDPQSIIGYVNFKDIVAHMKLSPHEPTLRGIIRNMISFPDDMPASTCLETLMRERTHIALVRAEAGEVIGMVTLEDLIEELVGEIEDEYDRLPMHGVPSGAGWIVGGGIAIARLHELAGIDLSADVPASGARNLNEWVVGHLGRPVRGGEILERGEVRVLVRKVRRQKVLEAQMTRSPGSPKEKSHSPPLLSPGTPEERGQG
jgi:putative hemolysin